MTHPLLRLANNEDADGIVDLIDSILQEHNDRICLDGSESDLLDLAANYVAPVGAFWVLVDEGPRNSKIVGCHAAIADPADEQVCNFRRLYLDKPFRGTGWGHQLMQIAIDWAIDANFKRIEFWSDTRFHRAHEFFKKFGFQKSGVVRQMHDSHQPYDEFFFFLNINQ